MAPDDPKMTRPHTRNLEPLSTGRPIPSPSVTEPLDSELPWVIEFRVVGTASTVQTQIREAMVIGRDDPESQIFADVDLTPFDAYARGVSRRHALITARDGRISVRDLNSTNGTRLNGFDIQPGQEYRLRHGDELTIGQLRLQVMFMVVPSRGESGQVGDTIPSPLKIPIVGHGEHILIVEDDNDVGAVFRMALEQAGFRVTLVKNIQAAMEQQGDRLPDIVVVDLMLPDTGGLDFIRYLRKQQGEQRLAVLVVSSATAGFQMGKALEAGADLCLGKPLSIEELLNAVASISIKER